MLRLDPAFYTASLRSFRGAQAVPALPPIFAGSIVHRDVFASDIWSEIAVAHHQSEIVAAISSSGAPLGGGVANVTFNPWYMQEQTNTISDDAVLWTKEDLIRRTKFCLRSVDYWIETGQLPYVKIQRGVRFVPSDVEKFIQAHRIGG
jgi:hypothetical protein